MAGISIPLISMFILCAASLFLVLVIASTFFTLRASILEESTNPNHRTLADRAYAGEYGWRELIRMRVEAAVCLTLRCCYPEAWRCLLTIRPAATADWYGEMMSTLDVDKEFALHDQAFGSTSRAA